MFSHIKLAVLLSCLWFSTIAIGGGVTIIESNSFENGRVFLDANATQSVVAGPNGENGIRIDVGQAGEKNWSVMYHSPLTTGPIRKGDLLAYEVTIRISGERAEVGNIGVYAEGADSSKGSVGGAILPTTEIQTFRRSVVSPDDFDAGDFRLSVHLGAQPQVVEIYGAKLDVFPPDASMEDLRVDGITWKGREADSAWRKAAAARIDRLRKADVHVSVMTADGKPVPDAAITIKQTRHAWRFGTFVSRQMLEDTPDGKRYRDLVLERYNFVTLPAYLANWGWRNDNSRLNYFRLADWAYENQLETRGHLLVYPGWTATPSEWFTIPKTELREKLAAHIPRAIRAFKSRGVTEWDVANELRFNKEFVEEIGGLEVAANWFKLARKHLPKGQLYLNETIILPNDGHTETEQVTFENHVETLAQLGAPIDGIGLQGHFRSEMTSPVRLLEILDRMAKLDRDIMITEFDMDNDDKRAQAAYLRDFYTVCFSHPRVRGIVQWGFWENNMWQPRGHHFTKDWTETELAKSYYDLVYRQWWSNEHGNADDTGSYSSRVFQGTHNLSVRNGEYAMTMPITVEADGAKIEVVVP